MSKKLTVLAAAKRLQSFTLTELARSAGVSTPAAQSVLDKALEGWFFKAQQQPGSQESQPVRYELSPEGSEAIRRTLEASIVATSITRQQSFPSVPPLGLAAAGSILNAVASSPTKVRAELLDDALENLEWIEREFREGVYSGPSTENFLRDIEVKRQLIDDALSRTYRPRLLPVRHIYRTNIFPDISSRLVPDIGMPALTGINRLWGRAIFSVLKKYIAQSVRTSLGDIFHATRQVEESGRVLINYLDNDINSQVLAGYARGALASAVRDRNMPLELSVQKLVIEGGTLHDTWRDLNVGAGKFGHAVLCINSEFDPVEVVESVAVYLKSESSVRAVVVLDCGFNSAVETLTRIHHVAYTPNASEADALGWIVSAIQLDKSKT